MLIQTTIQKKETVTKEIQLPFYSKDDFGISYCITEDENVLRVSNYAIGKGVLVFKKRADKKAEYTQEAASAIPITQEEFEAALEEAVNYMDESLSAIVARRMSRANANGHLSPDDLHEQAIHELGDRY